MPSVEGGKLIMVNLSLWVRSCCSMSRLSDILQALVAAGRAHHMGSVIVGKVHPSHHCCYIAYGGNEHKKDEYEVLVNPGNFKTVVPTNTFWLKGIILIFMMVVPLKLHVHGGESGFPEVMHKYYEQVQF